MAVVKYSTSCKWGDGCSFPQGIHISPDLNNQKIETRLQKMAKLPKLGTKNRVEGDNNISTF